VTSKPSTTSTAAREPELAASRLTWAGWAFNALGGELLTLSEVHERLALELFYRRARVH